MVGTCKNCMKINPGRNTKICHKLLAESPRYAAKMIINITF
jgi:hypothetical protein